MYASVGGTLVTATLVREPIAHLFSAWYMWPPLGGNETQPADFATWAEGTEAAQAGLLVGERRDVMHTRFAPKARGMHSSDSTSSKRCSILEEARSRLARFDIVGVTDCVPSLLRKLEARLALQPPICKAGEEYSQASTGKLHCLPAAGEERPARRAWAGAQWPVYDHVVRPKPYGRPRAILEAARRWSWSNLRLAQRRRLLELTRCDASLYADATLRAIRPLEAAQFVGQECWPSAHPLVDHNLPSEHSYSHSTALAQPFSTCAGDSGRCGATPGDIVFVRHHKTGCVLTHGILKTLQAFCGWPVDTHSEWPVAVSNGSRATISTRLTFLPTSSDFDPSRGESCSPSFASYPTCVTSPVAQKLERGVRYVQIIRDPFSLVVSMYKFHRSNAECRRDHHMKTLCATLRRLPADLGVVMVAEAAAADTLPTMATLHSALQSHSRPDRVLTLRLEQFTAGASSFDAATRQLLRFYGVSQACLIPAMQALAAHDISRWNEVQVAAQGEHLTTSRQVAEPWSNASFLTAVLRGHGVVRNTLARFARQLGYAHRS